MGIQALKQREMQIEREGNLVLIPKMVKKNKVEFVHSFVPTVKDKVLTNAPEDIPPNLLYLVQVEEVPPFLQLLLFLFRFWELLEGCVRNAGLLGKFNALLREPRYLSNKILRENDSNPMEGDSIVRPVVEEGLGNMRLTTFEPLQVIGHIAFLQDFPDILAFFPNLTTLRLLFTRLATHVLSRGHTHNPEKPDAEENVRMKHWG